MITTSRANPNAPGEIGGDEAAYEGADSSGNRRRCADQGINPSLGAALKIAVDQRLHRRKEQGGAETPEDAPEDDHWHQAGGNGHRQCPNRICDEADHIGSLPADQVSHLAADQNERRRNQGLDCNCGLDAAHRGTEIVDYGSD